MGGEKVSPAEVEQVILELNFVREALVAGAANPIMGQVVAATVALTSAMDERYALRRIRVHCRSRLAPHMVPVRIDFVSGSLSTARQKLQRTRSNLTRVRGSTASPGRRRDEARKAWRELAVKSSRNITPPASTTRCCSGSRRAR